uniref:Uncharacterized protein n=1 Tax=Schlesneria paludicola TaxID=360056 RepID=A0A7C2P0K3_9PLAN
MAKKSTTKSLAGQVPPEQLDLPVSIDNTGKFVTLREVMQPTMAAKAAALTSLTPEKKAELTARRIAAQPKYQMAMVGGGMIDKDRAIEEVKSQSEIGRLLVEIEQRVINHLMQTISQ